MTARFLFWDEKYKTRVTLLANLVPMRRGSRVDPISTLKYE
jgi:hypothetical protein